MAVNSTVYPMQSDKITGYTPGGYPIGDRAITGADLAEIDKEVYADGIISTAPNSGSYYQVNIGSGMQLTVNPGKCYIQGRKASTPSVTHITIDPADALVNRTDRIVLRLDVSNEVRDVFVDVKKGDISLVRTSSMWELGLADILVRKGSNAITQTDITDLRLDSAICGRAYNELLRVDTTGIFNQLQAVVAEQEAHWQEQTTEQQTDWQEQITGQQANWQTMTQAQRDDYSTWKAQIEQWASMTVEELSRVLSMNMDNQGAYPGTTYDCAFAPNGSVNEAITYNSGGILAERATVFNANGTITQTLHVYNTDGSLFMHTQSTTTFLPGGGVRVVVLNEL